MAGRNSKLVQNCTGHRTKAEKEAREQIENSLICGRSFKESIEVKSNETAHKLFLKIKKNLKAISKDDALFEQVINRYCIISAECTKLQDLYSQIFDDIEKTESMYESLDINKFFELKSSLYSHLNSIERRLNKKREMLLVIEKDNLMTIQGMLRAVPKKPPEEGDDPLADLLSRREARGDNICQFPQS